MGFLGTTHGYAFNDADLHIFRVLETWNGRDPLLDTVNSNDLRHFILELRKAVDVTNEELRASQLPETEKEMRAVWSLFKNKYNRAVELEKVQQAQTYRRAS